MTVAYQPPGVTATEQTSPAPAPVLAVPGTICLVGRASGVITQTETVQLVGTTGAVLQRVPTGATMTSGSIVSVIDVTNSSLGSAPNNGGFAVTTDYTWTSTTFTITRVVTSNTLSGSVSAAATSVTLNGGPVPAVGQIIRLTAGQTTETALVTVVVGQVLTLASPLVNGYAGSSPVTWGNIPDGDEVYVTYSYTPSDYFLPVQLTNMNDVQTRFGTAWTSSGGVTNATINSRLSFAAGMAFQNGASNVVLQALYVLDGSGNRIQPTDNQSAQPGTWQTVLNNLVGLEGFDIIVPVVGQSDPNVTDSFEEQIFGNVQSYINTERVSQGHRLVGVLGEDSSGDVTKATEATILAHAQQLQSAFGNTVSQQLVLLNTSRFAVPSSTSYITVGGQYVAAGVAGMLAARSPSATLTRQALSGVLQVTDFRTNPQKLTDAQNGLLVVENKGNLVQIRHGVTLDMTSVLTRELNVVRAKHYVIASVTQTLDTQVIGQIVADVNAPTTVNNLVIATLEDLRGANDISDYNSVQSRILSLDPTAMEVRFNYLPLFMVNYVTLVFSLDLTTQTINVTSPSVTNG